MCPLEVRAISFLLIINKFVIHGWSPGSQLDINEFLLLVYIHEINSGYGDISGVWVPQVSEKLV